MGFFEFHIPSRLVTLDTEKSPSPNFDMFWGKKFCLKYIFFKRFKAAFFYFCLNFFLYMCFFSRINIINMHFKSQVIANIMDGKAAIFIDNG